MALAIGSWTQQKLPVMLLCLGEPPMRLLWCWLLFVIHCCSSFTDVFTFPSYFSMPPALHPGFAGLWRSPPALSTTLVTFDCFCFFIQRYGCKWELFTHRRFLPYAPFPNIFDTTCFYQGLTGSRQFFLEVCRASWWSSKHRPGQSVWFTTIHNLHI